MAVDSRLAEGEAVPAGISQLPPFGFFLALRSRILGCAFFALVSFFIVQDGFVFDARGELHKQRPTRIQKSSVLSRDPSIVETNEEIAGIGSGIRRQQRRSENEES